MQLADHAGELDELSLWLNPSSPGVRVAPLPEDGSMLRMYPPGELPRAGSLRSDTLDVDSHWHVHDMHQLVYAFEGALEAEGGTGRHLIPRQLAAWIPAGAVHRLGLHKVRSGSVFFPAGDVANGGDRIRILLVSPLMREMLRESMRWPLHGEQSRLRTGFFDAMAALCGEWIGSEADLFLPTCHDPRLQRVVDYTSDHTEARLVDVCRSAGISERTLRRRLKTETGLTWEAYRQRQRLLRAVRLLGESGEGIARISADCGFESPSAFAKAFRSVLGVSPSEYRVRALERV